MPTPLSPTDFTRAAAQTLAGQTGVVVAGIDDLELYLEVLGQPTRLQLDHFYDIYLADPQSLPAILHSLFESLHDVPPNRTITDPAMLLQRIMPMLKPLALLNEIHEQQIPLLLYRPFLGELMITYVIDEGETVAYVSRDHLASWGLAEELVHQQALTNLRQRTTPPRISGTGHHSLLIWASNDGYDATRLLLPELLQPFARQLGGNVVLGVPSRDLLLGFGDDDSIIFEHLAAQITEDATTGPFPLTDQLFTLRNGRIQLYQQE
ncbi:MAG: DUF1444 family protein [Herpetosiphonaceae bacterium]|nr:DUF1444 family protein [Herpetosiphonaceae bacterium]